MPKVSLDCDIRSTEQKMTFSTTGTLKHHHLSFVDPTNNLHTIDWSDTLRYQKTGDATMDYRFDPNRNTVGTYQTNGLHFEFEIETKQYLVSEGIIRITYSLLQDSEVINRTTISIDYAVTKEE